MYLLYLFKLKVFVSIRPSFFKFHYETITLSGRTLRKVTLPYNVTNPSLITLSVAGLVQLYMPNEIGEKIK